MKIVKPSFFGKMLLGKMLFLMVLAVSVPRASATVTYYVGSCESGSKATISDALASTPAPNVIKICPGTYPEQLFITKSVTLEGISSGNSDQVFITVPSGGLNTCALGEPAQVCVINAGTVDLTNISVDGGGSNPFYGILYFTTSGTLNQLEVRFQQTGIRLWEKSNTATIENSNVHNFTASGIQANDATTGGDASTIKIVGNTLAATPGAGSDIGVEYGASVTISNNFVVGPASPTTGTCQLCVGILAFLPSAGAVSGNTIVGSGINGIQIGPGAASTATSTMSVTSNTIFDISGDAIRLESGVTGVPVEGNTIMQTQYGINFGCNVGNTVNSNTLNAIHSDALANVPSSVTSNNTYYNVPTLGSGGCS